MDKLGDDRDGFGAQPDAPRNPSLIALLEDLKRGDPSIGVHRTIATYRIQLDTANGLASVHEEMARTSLDADVQWLQVFAGVVAFTRFCAFFEVQEATDGLVALSQMNAQPDNEWATLDDAVELDDPGMTLDVEICIGEPSGEVGGFIRLDPESAETPRTKTDLLMVFRDWLFEQRHGQIPRVARGGLNVLGFAAATGLINASTINDQLMAPLRVMQVLEREGLVYPHLGDEPLPSLDGSFAEDEGWTLMDIGLGGLS